MREYCLRSSSPTRPNATLAFGWDTAAGTVTGRDAETVLALCRQALADGGVLSHPYPTFHAVTDPLHCLSDMAVVLGHSWQLDAKLLAAYPHKDNPDTPEDVARLF